VEEDSDEGQTTNSISKSKYNAEITKFLGGDDAHTHLVKGLDKTLAEENENPDDTLSEHSDDDIFGRISYYQEITTTTLLGVIEHFRGPKTYSKPKGDLPSVHTPVEREDYCQRPALKKRRLCYIPNFGNTSSR